MWGTLMLIAVLASPVSAQLIGLYTTADPPPPVQSTPPVQNEMILPPLTPTALYIVAHSPGTGALQQGIVAAEFGVVGVPDTNELMITWAPNPVANIDLGSPFDGGANIAFPACQLPSANQALMLYSAQVVALNPVANLTLTVGPHSVPSNPNLPFSQLVGCDGPANPVVEATGGSITINPAIAVAQTTWSATKQLYR